MEVARTSNRESSYVVIFQPHPCGAFLNVQNTIQKAMFNVHVSGRRGRNFRFFHSSLFSYDVVRIKLRAFV